MEDCLENQLKSRLPFDDDCLELGSGDYGCSHYRRRCRIIAPCCNEIYDCRHCHNESNNSLDLDPLKRHDIPRHEIKKVICSLCSAEQDVQQKCVNCGVCMGKYYCSKCNFFDDDVSKNQYHCDGCGICRTGGGENFFHCNRCECCYSNEIKDSHICIERAMHHNCPVCFEVWILCNDCGETSEVKFHIVGQKCIHCHSYNTRETREADSSPSLCSR